MSSDMEDKLPLAVNNQTVKLRFTNVPPASYRLMIESFSLLLETKVEKYETNEFDAGGYKWRLVFYPNGKGNGDINGHVSMFLVMAEPKNNSLGWDVRVNVNFFVRDQIRDRYLIIHDNDRIEWRFDNMKTEWGITNLLSHDALNDASNGYLVDDSCVFGVEVFVVESTHIGETLSLVKKPKNGLYTWKIDNFSALSANCHESKIFTVGGQKWNLELNPNGNLIEFAADTHLSLYLVLKHSETFPQKRKLYAKYTLSMRDQINGKHHEKEGEHWFDSPGNGWGFAKFILLSDLKNSSNGYLLNDHVIVEVKFDVISVVKIFS